MNWYIKLYNILHKFWLVCYWKIYYSSNDELQNLIKEFSKKHQIKIF